LNAGVSLAGLISFARLKRLGREQRSSTTVADVACSLTEIVTCGPDEGLDTLVRRTNTSADQRAVVLDHGRFVGIVSPRDIIRAVETSGSHPPSLPERQYSHQSAANARPRRCAVRANALP
jgi:CBS-domain-containing membrane protein